MTSPGAANSKSCAWDAMSHPLMVPSEETVQYSPLQGISLLADVCSGPRETAGNAALPLSSTSAVWQVDSLIDQMLDRLAQSAFAQVSVSSHANKRYSQHRVAGDCIKLQTRHKGLQGRQHLWVSTATALIVSVCERSSVRYWCVGTSKQPMTPLSVPMAMVSPSGARPMAVTPASCSACMLTAHHQSSPLCQFDRLHQLQL